MMNEEEPIDIEPTYLSSDEDSETHFPMSDQELTNKNDEH